MSLTWRLVAKQMTGHLMHACDQSEAVSLGKEWMAAWQLCTSSCLGNEVKRPPKVSLNLCILTLLQLGWKPRDKIRLGKFPCSPCYRAFSFLNQVSQTCLRLDQTFWCPSRSNVWGAVAASEGPVVAAEVQGPQGKQGLCGHGPSSSPCHPWSCPTWPMGPEFCDRPLPLAPPQVFGSFLVTQQAGWNSSTGWKQPTDHIFNMHALSVVYLSCSN